MTVTTISRSDSHHSEKLPHHDEKTPQLTEAVRAVPADEIDAAEDIILAESEFTKEEYARVVHKIDFILLPLLMILYGIQFSDKTSLSYGVVFGLAEDTKLVGNQYATLTSFFYMSYALAQYPMAWLLQRLPLARTLAVCIIIWGGLVMALAGCNNYAQLVVVRVFLGWFEAVVTPGFALYTTSFYLRKEQTLRQCLYYAMNSCFAMILGVGVFYLAQDAERKGGMAAWRVINLFLGGITVGMGIIFLVVGGMPNEVWWLSKREKRMVHARLVSNATGGAEQHPWKWSQVRECFRDPQYYCAVMCNCCTSIPNGAITTFQSLIFRSFGFTPLETVKWGLPTYACTFVVCVASAVCVRYVRHTRFPLAILLQLLTMIALLYVGLTNDGRWQKWGAWNLSLMYSISTFILYWPVMSINVAGRTKKAWVGASSLLAYCVGNVVGAQILLPSDAPRYIKGMTGCAIVIAVGVVTMLYWWWYYTKENRRREEEFAASGLTLEQREHLNRLNGETDMTDLQNPHFRYMS